jgi:hypothetical protein
VLAYPGGARAAAASLEVAIGPQGRICVHNRLWSGGHYGAIEGDEAARSIAEALTTSLNTRGQGRVTEDGIAELRVRNPGDDFVCQVGRGDAIVDVFQHADSRQDRFAIRVRVRGARAAFERSLARNHVRERGAPVILLDLSGDGFDVPAIKYREELRRAAASLGASIAPALKVASHLPDATAP